VVRNSDYVEETSSIGIAPSCTKSRFIVDHGNQNQHKIADLVSFTKDYGFKEKNAQRANIGFPSTEDYRRTLQE